MPSATLGSVNYAPGDFSSTSQWVETYQPGQPIYEKEYFNAAGEDGEGVKRYGFRSRLFTFNVVYVVGSEDGVRSAIAADAESLANVAFTTSIDGTDYPSCELISMTHDQPMSTGFNGMYTAKCVVVVNQKRLT